MAKLTTEIIDTFEYEGGVVFEAEVRLDGVWIGSYGAPEGSEDRIPEWAREAYQNWKED